MERSARFVVVLLLRHIAAAEFSENRDRLFAGIVAQSASSPELLDRVVEGWWSPKSRARAKRKELSQNIFEIFQGLDWPVA
jgi:hypothetical protein